MDRNIRCGKTDVSDGEGVDQAAQRLAEDRWGGGAQRVLPTRRSEALTAGDPSICFATTRRRLKDSIEASPALAVAMSS